MYYILVRENIINKIVLRFYVKHVKKLKQIFFDK